MVVPQADPEQQKKAIQSIFSYVHDAAQFIVLAARGSMKTAVSGLPHVDAPRLVSLELLANAMGPTQKNVLAESATQVISTGQRVSLGSRGSTALGEFTVRSTAARSAR